MQMPLWCKVLRSIVRHSEHQVRHHVAIQKWRSLGVGVSDLALIATSQNSCLEIGQGSSVGAYSLLDLGNDPAIGATGQSVRSVLKIGCRTAINEFNNIRAGGGSIVIGNDCLIAQFVSIIASNHAVDVSVPI